MASTIDNPLVNSLAAYASLVIDARERYDAAEPDTFEREASYSQYFFARQKYEAVKEAFEGRAILR